MTRSRWVKRWTMPAQTASSSAGADPLMPAAVSQADLERFGVAPDVAAELKQVTTEDALQRLVEALPASQGNAVLDLAFGKDPQDVWNDLVIEEPGPIDVDDLETALKRPLSRLSFTAVDGDNEEELRAVLEGDFAKWRVWLHPLQRKLATHEGWNGPFRVTGGAGTGKTVTAIHRARFLAKQLGFEWSRPEGQGVVHDLHAKSGPDDRRAADSARRAIDY